MELESHQRLEGEVTRTGASMWVAMATAAIDMHTCTQRHSMYAQPCLHTQGQFVFLPDFLPVCSTPDSPLLQAGTTLTRQSLDWANRQWQQLMAHLSLREGTLI